MLGEGHSVRSTSPKGNFENCTAVTALIARPDTTISALASARVSFGFSLLTSVFPLRARALSLPGSDAFLEIG